MVGSLGFEMVFNVQSDGAYGLFSSSTLFFSVFLLFMMAGGWETELDCGNIVFYGPLDSNFFIGISKRKGGKIREWGSFSLFLPLRCADRLRQTVAGTAVHNDRRGLGRVWRDMAWVRCCLKEHLHFAKDSYWKW